MTQVNGVNGINLNKKGKAIDCRFCCSCFFGPFIIKSVMAKKVYVLG